MPYAEQKNKKEAPSKVLYPKYYKNLNESPTFLFLGRLGRQESTANFCNYPTFEDDFFSFKMYYFKSIVDSSVYIHSYSTWNV